MFNSPSINNYINFIWIKAKPKKKVYENEP